MGNVKILIFYLILSLTFPLSAHAEDAQSQYYAQQAGQYTKAAKMADKAADTNDLLWKVWAGVGAICIAVCASSFGGSELFGADATPYVCPGATMAAGITDAVMTKEFTGAIMGIMGAGASIALAPDKPESKIVDGKKVEPKVSKNWGACLSGAMATVQVFMKRQAMDDARQSAKSNRKTAEQLLNQKSGTSIAAAQPVILPAKGAATASTDNTGATNSGAGNSLSGKTADASETGSSSVCKSSGSDLSQTIQCAVAQDSNLPEFVNSPNFAKNFKKTSGIDFDKFLSKKSDTAAKAIQGAVGAALGAGKTAELGALVAQYESRYHAMGGDEGSAYAGGGGGGSGGGAPSEAIDPQAIVEGLMAQLLPQEGAQVASLDHIERANRLRSPGSIVDDPKINLFERVSFRYQTVTRRNLSQ